MDPSALPQFDPASPAAPMEIVSESERKPKKKAKGKAAETPAAPAKPKAAERRAVKLLGVTEQPGIELPTILDLRPENAPEDPPTPFFVPPDAEDDPMPDAPADPRPDPLRIARRIPVESPDAPVRTPVQPISPPPNIPPILIRADPDASKTAAYLAALQIQNAEANKQRVHPPMRDIPDAKNSRVRISKISLHFSLSASHTYWARPGAQLLKAGSSASSLQTANPPDSCRKAWQSELQTRTRACTSARSNSSKASPFEYSTLGKMLTM